MLNIEELAQKGELFDGRYKLLKTLSTEGGTADVWLAVDVNTIDSSELVDEVEDSGMLVAIKIYRPKNALDVEGEQRFRDEYKIVHNCRHTNLLQPTNFSICDGVPYLELPYCKNGSSELLIGKTLSDKEVWQFIFDVASGLAYLHACNPPIIHQDVKPANILIDDDHRYAITDFGISSRRGGSHGYLDEENSGTLAYMAPERFLPDYRPMAESDIWGVGATLYEILTGNVPYGEEGGRNQRGTNRHLAPLGKNISSDVQQLITACLSFNPKDRPTAERIIQIAEARLSPVSPVKKYGWMVTLVVVLVVGGFFLFRGHAETEEPVDELFQKALRNLNAGSLDEVRSGLNTMDSLAYADYVPAMYELAYTYGWYSDSLSVRRKQILGIAYYDTGAVRYMPVSNKYNYKATELFTRIIESKDSINPGIKANAAYRLACYYVNQNNVYKTDLKKAKILLLSSKKYAVEADDTVLLRRINSAMKQFEK